MPGMFALLGYDPRLTPQRISGEILAFGRAHGVSLSQAARMIGVDPSTLARWERGERQPDAGAAERVRHVISKSVVL